MRGAAHAPASGMRAAALLSLVLVATAAAAQERVLFPTFSVTAGAYAGQFDTTVRIDDAGAEGT